MTASTNEPRRVRVERNIYRRTNSAGHTIYEVGYRDSSGRQRWHTVAGGITAALLMVSQNAERLAALDEREAGNHRQVGDSLAELTRLAADSSGAECVGSVG